MATALGKVAKRSDSLRLGIGELNISGLILLLFIKSKRESRKKDKNGHVFSSPVFLPVSRLTPQPRRAQLLPGRNFSIRWEH